MLDHPLHARGAGRAPALIPGILKPTVKFEGSSGGMDKSETGERDVRTTPALRGGGRNGDIFEQCERRSSVRAPRSDVRIFFWMPKTAGGTIAAGIRNDPGVQWLCSPDAIPAASGCQIWFGGHVHFGHHLICNAEPAYFTVLRDPIERLISEFFYHHQHPLPGIFIPDDEIVPSFIRLVEAAPHLNYYSYMFSAFCAEKEAIEEGSPSWDGDPVTGFNLVGRRLERRGFLTESALFRKANVDLAFRQGLRNILSMMRLVGFFDHLDRLPAYLDREFGLKVTLDMHMHKTTWKPDLDGLPSRIVTMLKRKTEADYEIFDRTRRSGAAALPRRYRV